MKVIALPVETQARLNFNTKIIIDYTDLQAWTSGTAQALLPQNTVGSDAIKFPAGYQLAPGIVANVITAFTSSGGAITSLGLSVGDGGSATRYLNAVDLKSTGYTGGTVGYTYTAADTVDGTATIVGQTMASLNAGQVEIYCNLRPVPDLVAVK
jgi:hypothetical protein